jgi:hypothetical protein
MSRRGLGRPEKGLQSVMFHRQLLLTHAPSGGGHQVGAAIVLHRLGGWAAVAVWSAWLLAFWLTALAASAPGFRVLGLMR